jgi:hypothetical protein
MTDGIIAEVEWLQRGIVQVSLGLKDGTLPQRLTMSL